MKKTVALVYDLRTVYLAEGYTETDVAEFDSEDTIKAIEKALLDLGYRIDHVGHARELCRRLVSGERWDLVFNVAEGLSGRSREAQVPAILELFGVPYTFSDPLTCAATLDKAVAKRLVASAGLATPDWSVVRDARDMENAPSAYPVFAKPLAEGTGKGIDSRSRISSSREFAEVVAGLLKAYKQPVIVEQYLPGREFTTALLGTGDSARVLGTFEVQVRDDAPHRDYSLEVKEMCEAYVNYLPVEEGRLRGEVEELALQSYRALECRDAGRVDIRLDAGGQPFFLELNPLPGLHPTHSDLPMIAAAHGVEYTELIGAIAGSAMRRVKEQHAGVI